ncbi:MAG: restriction endonuclease subunit S [Syntrophomonadaceae bacterium]|nr:restriction endonuclease subunit S [Syntrophomonadaceae bacterium]
MKNSILQLAIQGKLVEQRPEEGTAEELYQRIQDILTSKDNGKRKGKSQNIIYDLSEDDVPFDIPETWKWVRLGKIGYTNIGLTYSPQNISDNGTIVLRSSNIQDGRMAYEDIVQVLMDIPDNKMCNKGDILICTRNGSKRLVGKAAIIDQDGMSFGAFMAIFRSVCNEYILYVINSTFFRNSLLGDTGTTTINQITQDMIKNAIIPLPPLAEQKRIVAKIQELLPYIERYELAWRKLEDFNKRFPDNMQKSILQMAIQGKLVEQCPEEGAGEELYHQIQAEKEKLIKDGTIKKEKPLPEITEEEKPFDIPENWKWVRVGEVMSVYGGKRIPAGRQLVDEDTGHKYIRVTDMKNGSVLNTQIKYVTEDIYKIIKAYTISQNDVYITVAGTIGQPGLVPEEFDYANLTENADKLIVYSNHKEFVYNMMSSPLVQYQIYDAVTKVGQPKLAIARIQMLVIPLPPLAEQKRIVVKLEEILPLCEKLKR